MYILILYHYVSIFSNFSIIESDYFSGGMQTNLDDVISCSPEWELKQLVAIPPTINEG